MENKQTYYAALNKWGRDVQLIIAIEEMGELIQALSKFLNGRCPESVVENEIADVMIMMEQLQIVFSAAEIQNRKEAKLARLKMRLSD